MKDNKRKFTGYPKAYARNPLTKLLYLYKAGYITYYCYRKSERYLRANMEG